MPGYPSSSRSRSRSRRSCWTGLTRDSSRWSVRTGTSPCSARLSRRTRTRTGSRSLLGPAATPMNLPGASGTRRRRRSFARRAHCQGSTRSFALGYASRWSSCSRRFGRLSCRRAGWRDAAPYLIESRGLLRGDRARLAKVLSNLTAALADTDPAGALAAVAESAAIRRTLGDRAGLPLCLNNQGDLSLRSGDPATARESFIEAVAIRRSLA
jgi:hypothetical protein